MPSHEDSVFRRLLKNASYLFSANVIRSLGLFLQVVLVSRALGPELYGVLVQTIAAVALIVDLIDLRVWEFMVKYLSEFMEKRDYACAKAQIRLGYLLDGVTGLIAFGILLVSAPFAAALLDEPRISLVIYILAVQALFATINQTSTAILQVLDRFTWLSAEIVSHTLVLLLSLLSSLPTLLT